MVVGAMVSGSASASRFQGYPPPNVSHCSLLIKPKLTSSTEALSSGTGARGGSGRERLGRGLGLSLSLPGVSTAYILARLGFKGGQLTGSSEALSGGTGRRSGGGREGLRLGLGLSLSLPRVSTAWYQHKSRQRQCLLTSSSEALASGSGRGSRGGGEGLGLGLGLSLPGVATAYKSARMYSFGDRAICISSGDVAGINTHRLVRNTGRRGRSWRRERPRKSGRQARRRRPRQRRQ